jgi:uncharacterized protein (TIGR04255 family)
MASTAAVGIDFEAPPLSEVICGVRFSPLMEMTVAQLGAFCSSLQRQLPDISSSRLSPPVPPEMLRRSIPPLPRTIASASDGTEAVQIQQNQFVYNWAKPRTGGEYPHFPKVFQAFQDYLNRFTQFIETTSLEPLKFEGYVLNYVNQIDAEQGWSGPNDTERFLLGFSALSHPRLREFHWHPTYALDHQLGILEVVVGFRARSSDSARVLRFELEASYDVPKEGLPVELSSWFSQARRAIDQTFLELTTPEAQTKVWKRRG